MSELKKVLVALPEPLIKGLEHYRRAQEDLPSRNEAIRRLLSSALDEAGIKVDT